MGARPRLYTSWLLVGFVLIVVGLIWLLGMTSALVMPAILAGALAAATGRIVDALERHRLPRAARPRGSSPRIDGDRDRDGDHERSFISWLATSRSSNSIRLTDPAVVKSVAPETFNRYNRRRQS